MYRVLIPIVLAMSPSLLAAQPYSGQAYPGQDARDARSDRISAGTAPDVAAANRAVAGRMVPTGTVAPADQAAYEADVRAYDAARHARRQVIRRNQAYYDREQRAYAMAMADWRAQVAACRRGHTRACRLPTPRPGDYM
jgi:hypothetical protein